jgi:hypothetical protein
MEGNFSKRRFASEVVIMLAVIFLYATFAQRADACGDQTVANLHVNGSSLVIGTVTFYNDETNLHIKFETAGDWIIKATHLDLAADVNAIPHTSKGNPEVGHFRYKSEPGLQKEHTFVSIYQMRVKYISKASKMPVDGWRECDNSGGGPGQEILFRQ